jgi:hypothetical protein
MPCTRPRRSVSAALALALAAALAVAAPRADASVADRLARARAELRDLTTRIETQVAAADELRARVTAAGRRIDAVHRRLGLLLDARHAVEAAVAEAAEDYERARGEIAEIALEAFIGAPGATSEVALVAAALGAPTIGEVGDSVAYAAAVGEARADAAERVAVARARLESRTAALDAVLVERAGALEELEAARGELSEALVAHEAAAAALEASRDEAIALVSRLSARAAAAALGGVGAAFAGPYHVSYGEWAEGFLRRIGVPACRENRVVVVAWQVQESTRAAWNPLATTRRMPGSTDFNEVGVQNFVSLRQGLEATRRTVEHGLEVYGYGAIVDSLRRCDDALVTAEAIAASSWCPGCLGGMYVVGVVPKVDADYAAYAAI